MAAFPQIHGEISNWDVIVIGHLKVNTYFGESYDAPPRGDPSTCTSVMIRGKQADGRPYVLIVDPTVRLRAEDYDFDVNRRTGLRLGDVTHCYCTHHHLDHYEAFQYFPRAQWLAAPAVATLVRRECKKFDVSGLEDADGEFLPGVHDVPLPGHTESLTGLAFAFGGKKILAAGDSIMSKYHFEHGTTDFQRDPTLAEKAAQSIADMKKYYDIVIPGHDNLIVV